MAKRRQFDREDLLPTDRVKYDRRTVRIQLSPARVKLEYAFCVVDHFSFMGGTTKIMHFVDREAKHQISWNSGKPLPNRLGYFHAELEAATFCGDGLVVRKLLKTPDAQVLIMDPQAEVYMCSQCLSKARGQALI